MPSQNEIRHAITNQIVEALKSGNLPPWRRPWALDPNCGSPRSLSTLRGYRGINVLLLALASMKHGYRSRWWGSFPAVKQAGGYVRRGEKASSIILFRPATKTVTTDTGEEEEEKFAVMRTFCVFNAEQTTGLDHFHAGRRECCARHKRRPVSRREGASLAVARWSAEWNGVRSARGWKPGKLTMQDAAEGDGGGMQGQAGDRGPKV